MVQEGIVLGHKVSKMGIEVDKANITTRIWAFNGIAISHYQKWPLKTLKYKAGH